MSKGVEEELTNIAEWQKQHRESWGHVVPYVHNIQVDGRTARLHDCQDASKAGVADARTHKLYPETLGSSHAHFVATMRKGADGRWRLATKKLLETPCTRPSASR